MSGTFTVFFDGQFWVGVLEVAGPDGVRAARHVFGGEPTGPELLRFVRRDFLPLLERALTAPPVPDQQRRAANPKRLAREAARQMAARPVSTAAQEALKAQREAARHAARVSRRERRRARAEHRREVARAKAKARHRGR